MDQERDASRVLKTALEEKSKAQHVWRHAATEQPLECQGKLGKQKIQFLYFVDPWKTEHNVKVIVTPYHGDVARMHRRIYEANMKAFVKEPEPPESPEPPELCPTERFTPSRSTGERSGERDEMPEKHSLL